MDRVAGTGHGRIAGMKMLVAIDCNRAMLGKGGTDSVGPLGSLGPVGTWPQAPATEGLVVRGSPPSLNGHAVCIAKQYTASGIPNGQEQPVQDRLGGGRHGLHGLTGLTQLFSRNDGGATTGFWIQAMQGH